MGRQIANILIRRRWIVLAAWAAGAACLAVTAPVPSLRESPSTELLPPSAASRAATEALGEHFPVAAGLSQAVVVVERADDPARPGVETLTPADLAAMERIRRRILDPAASPYGGRIDLKRLNILSPTEIPLLSAAMVSPPRAGRGQAAVMTVQIPADRIDDWSLDVADHVQYILDTADLPEGLDGFITGAATFRRDYARAVERSQRRALWAALAAMTAILLIVYRAPLTVLVAVAAVAVAAVAATGVTAAAGAAGAGLGGVERIFLYVLLFGATVNYSLFYLAGFREGLSLGRPPAKAAADSWLATAPVIAASAATTVAGLGAMALARYGLFRRLGPVAAAALGIAFLAALTLVPALATICGERLLWPAQRRAPYRHTGPLWLRIGSFISRRPALTAAATLIVLALPAVRASRPDWSYDTLTELKPAYPAMRGAARIRRHWSAGELAPIGVLIETPQATSTAAFERLSQRLTAALAALPGVAEVRSVTAPLGVRAAPQLTAEPDSLLGGLGDTLADPLGGLRRLGVGATARKSYLRPRAMRLEIIPAGDAFGPEAEATATEIRQIIGRSLAGTPLRGATVHLAGQTAEMIDIRHLTQTDFRRVAAAALVVIALIAFALIRDAAMTIFMVGGTVAAYLASLGLTGWLFADGGGIDWKVGIFLFVVMAAVGQDYNLFLVARLAAEGRGLPPRRAARRAVTATGGIISTAGLIMAAALGSLAAGDLNVLVELGFALAVGILIDAFCIRPLLIPALAALSGRTGRAIGAAGRPGVDGRSGDG